MALPLELNRSNSLLSSGSEDGKGDMGNKSVTNITDKVSKSGPRVNKQNAMIFGAILAAFVAFVVFGLIAPVGVLGTISFLGGYAIATGGLILSPQILEGGGDSEGGNTIVDQGKQRKIDVITEQPEIQDNVTHKSENSLNGDDQGKRSVDQNGKEEDSDQIVEENPSSSGDENHLESGIQIHTSKKDEDESGYFKFSPIISQISKSTEGFFSNGRRVIRDGIGAIEACLTNAKKSFFRDKGFSDERTSSDLEMSEIPTNGNDNPFHSSALPLDPIEDPFEMIEMQPRMCKKDQSMNDNELLPRISALLGNEVSSSDSGELEPNSSVNDLDDISFVLASPAGNIQNPPEKKEEPSKIEQAVNRLGGLINRALDSEQVFTGTGPAMARENPDEDTWASSTSKK